MWWWIPAICEYAQMEFRQIVYPILGAAAGASLGSLRSWYWSRWQCGLLIGLCVGYSVDYLAKSPHGSPQVLRLGRPYLAAPGDLSPEAADQFIRRRLTIVAASVGGLASCLVAMAAGYWFAQADSWQVRLFREQPFRWLATRSTVWLLLTAFLISVTLWSYDHRASIGRIADSIQCDRHDLPLLREPMQSSGISLARVDGHWQLGFGSAEALSSPVLSELDCTPCVVISVSLTGEEIGDGELRNFIPWLSTTRFLELSRSAVTDASLLALAICTKLQRITIVDCASITEEGVARFRKRRPDVRVDFHPGAVPIPDKQAELDRQ